MYISGVRSSSATSTTCILDDCEEPGRARGLCNRHYRRWHLRGKPADLSSLAGGRRQRARTQFRRQDRDGYWLIWENGQWIREHRKVMEGMLGRPLREDETVHHRNGDKGDNAPTNLELWASLHPPGQRVSDLVAFAKEILDRYA